MGYSEREIEDIKSMCEKLGIEIDEEYPDYDTAFSDIEEFLEYPFCITYEYGGKLITPYCDVDTLKGAMRELGYE